MLKQFLLLFFLFLSFDTVSQNVKKALKLYEKGDSVKVREVLKKMDEKGDNNPGKHFIYSLIYLNNYNDRELLDSSFFRIKESKKNFVDLDEKISLELKELNINLLKLDNKGSENRILKGIKKNLHKVDVIITEIQFWDYYSQKSNFYNIEKIIRNNFELYDISYVAKNPENFRTDYIDAIYVNKNLK